MPKRSFAGQNGMWIPLLTMAALCSCRSTALPPAAGLQEGGDPLFEETKKS